MPGWVPTERQLAKWWSPEGEAQTLSDQALKKRITPDEFVQMVLFLAADDGGGCTAQSFMVDGGRFSDAEAAVRLVRERADDFGVDPGRVGFMGFSAGGNVTVRVALTDDPAARPDFVAPIYATLTGVELDTAPEGSGPMFVVAATNDELGLARDSLALYDAWRRARLPVELHLYASGGHGFGMRTQHLPSDTWIDRFLDWFDATGLATP
jgi:acetyl esterase/lipase